jgi:glutamine amidotransferase
MVHPIPDQYYDRSPYHRRSAMFVQTKGLAANEKTLAPASANPPGPLCAERRAQKSPGPTIPFSVLRSLSPKSSNSALARAKNAASQSGVRPLEPPPVIRTTSTQPRAQGNIKKKRASPATADASSLSSEDSDPQSPVTPEPPNRVSAQPNKLARFFPELVWPH